MRALALAVALLGALVVAQAQPRLCTATLKKWARLPARTFIQPPKKSSSMFESSGLFLGPGNRRNETPNTLRFCSGFSTNPTVANPRCTEITGPFINQGQPVQGFSGIKSARSSSGAPNDDFYIVSDNGFGGKRNSADNLLFWHQVRADWSSKTLTRVQSVFLSDPNKKLPFVIREEGTKKRFLTGADFDVESIQITRSGTVFIGDEFGPYIIEFDSKGRALAYYDIPFNGTIVRSPDSPDVSLNNPDGGAPTSVNLRRSRGFEGMAQSPDGKYLYPMLEGPIFNQTTKTYENIDGKEILRIFKFNLETRKFEGEPLKYVLDVNGHAIGDFNMVDARYGMVIERDNNEGLLRQACTGGSTGPQGRTCFEEPLARFKRVFLIDMQAGPDMVAKKVAYIDLLDIKDPAGVSGSYAYQGTFQFPFVTIEDVDVYDKATSTIVIGNDNNFPWSSGRTLGKVDDNELAILEVPGFFNGGQC